MKILGLTSGIHDTSATLVVDGQIIAVGEEERFNRERHTGKFPINAIKFCLEKGDVFIDKIDVVCVGMKWDERAKARLEMRLKVAHTPELISQAHAQAQEDMKRHAEVSWILEEKFGYKGKIIFRDHYDSHASSAYFPSEFSSAAILVIDGAGERASARIYKAREAKLERLMQLDYPNSIGRFYAWITDYLGFQIDSDEGKVMGLAPYGDESLVPLMSRLVNVKLDGSYELDYSYFGFIQDNKKGFSKKFYELFGSKRNKGEPLTQHHKNIARAAQVVLEETVLGLARLAKDLTKEENLCISGGVALNSVANGKIIDAGIFKNVYIYPASGDAGTGIGAALYQYHSTQEKKAFYSDNQSPYLGYESNEDEILAALKKYGIAHTKPKDLFKEVAKLIFKNKVVGWFQGRAEIGPRALGNRSILANPTVVENKDRVNDKIKFRESFRPFAPSILKNFDKEYFDTKGIDSPYMIMAFDTKADKRDLIPAVVHVDGTARVQTVTKERNERYWKLVSEFYKLSGIPVLLNTSFNRAGEVIVNTPEQAIETFLDSDLDVLVLGDYLVLK